MISTLRSACALHLYLLLTSAAIGLGLGCRDQGLAKSVPAAMATAPMGTPLQLVEVSPAQRVALAQKPAIPSSTAPSEIDATRDEDEPAAPPAKPRHDERPTRKRAAPPDTSPRAPVEIAVRRGESMGHYARWAKLPMRALYARTSVAWGETLEVGQRLSLKLTADEKARLEAGRATLPSQAPIDARPIAPTPIDPNVASTTLRARPGDSGWRIARRRGVSMRVLEALNPGRDLSRLQVGDEVKVPVRDGES